MSVCTHRRLARGKTPLNPLNIPPKKLFSLANILTGFMFFKRFATQTFAKVVDNLSALGQNPMDILKLFLEKDFDKLQNLIGRGKFGVKNKSFKCNFNEKLT